MYSVYIYPHKSPPAVFSFVTVSSEFGFLKFILDSAEGSMCIKDEHTKDINT